MSSNVFSLVGRIHTKREIDAFQQELRYGDFEMDSQRTLGQITVMALCFGLLLSVVVTIFVFYQFHVEIFGIGMLAFIAGFLMGLFGFKFYFVRMADQKGQYIDKVLAAWLNLLANKMESGDSIERALLLSARPEFGLLRTEIIAVVNDINLGTSVKEALHNMKRRVKSRNVEELVKLITYALESGGEFAKLLKKMAIRINDKFINEQQMRAELSSQLSIITIIILGAAPAMFGLANVLVKVVVTIVAGIDLGDDSSVPFQFTASDATVTTIMYVSIASLVILCVMGSLMLGAIKEGEAKAGIRTIPMYILIALIVFFASKFMLSKVLGGIIGF